MSSSFHKNTSADSSSSSDSESDSSSSSSSPSSSKVSAERTKPTLKDLFAPKPEDAKFSLLGHLDIELDLDDELDFSAPAETAYQGHEQHHDPTPISQLLSHPPPTTSTQVPFSQLPPDPRQPLFFPHPSSFPFANSTYVPHNKARDMFDVSRDKGWDPKLGVFVNVNVGDDATATTKSAPGKKNTAANTTQTQNPGWAMRKGLPLPHSTNNHNAWTDGSAENANTTPLALPLPPPGFYRTSTAEGVRARWEAEKGARTQDWKRRCREAGKVGRRRGVGAEVE